MCIDPLSMSLAAAGVPGVGGISGILGSLGMGGIGTAATVASGAASAYSAVQQGNAAESAAKATAKQQQEAAVESLRQGTEESDRQRRAGAVQIAQQKIAMAANGIDLGSASAIEVMDDTKAMIEDDAFAIRHNAGQQARGYAQQAANSLTQGRNAQSESRWGAFNTILNTGAKVGPKFRAWSQAGAY